MSAQPLFNPLPIYTGLDGQPMTGGFVYIGKVNLDPRSYPIAISYDDAKTISAVQPLRTTAGYIYRNGSPARIFVSEEPYSVMVLDSLGRQVSYLPNVQSDAAAVTAAASHIYQGAYSSGPLTRPDGSARQLGDVYFGTDGLQRRWDGASWLNIEQNAKTSETNAAASATAAALARDTAFGTARLYANTAAGIAATSSGQYFAVVSGSASEVAIIYLNSAGVATDTGKRIPSTLYLDDSWHDRLFAAQARAFEAARLRLVQLQRPKCLVLIALGQSNNAAFNTSISGTVSANAFMPFGGNAIGLFSFFASNNTNTTNFTDVGSMVPHVESSAESTLSGAILMLQDVFPRIHACSVAIGGQPILILGGAGPRANLYAVVHKLCDHARTAGFEPVVAFTAVHGEANMTSFGQIDEATYYGYALAYYKMCQMVAAQAMGQPDYDAPIVFHTPGEMDAGAFSRGIVNAVVRLARDIPNGILGNSLFSWSMNPDLIHGDGVGFRERSEQDGWLLRKFFVDNVRYMGLRIVDAVRTGATVVVTFNDEMTLDTSTNYGTALNASNAKDGLEYTYDGTSYVAITAAVITGRKVTLTLASNPGGHAATEEIRCAMQTTTSGTWPTLQAGTQLRSTTELGFLSVYDPTYRQYVRPACQKFPVR